MPVSEMVVLLLLFIIISWREDVGEESSIELGRSSMRDLDEVEEVEEVEEDGPPPLPRRPLNIFEGDEGEVKERLFDKTPGEDVFEGDFLCRRIK